jgi:hypothetical protein
VVQFLLEVLYVGLCIPDAARPDTYGGCAHQFKMGATRC